VAQLFESLAGDPAWLREATGLRGELLDDLVHTEVTRRLLATRRAAAMVLFELRRREGPRTVEAMAALYRGLLQRATFAVLSDDDAQRWTLQADEWLSPAPQLLGSLLSAQLELSLRAPGAPWWKQPAPQLLNVWQGGRSLSALEAARTLGLA